MNIFLRELKAYRNSTIIWALSLSALTLVFLLMYPAFTKDVEQTRKVLSNLPLPVREALGISLKNFFTIFGFYSYLFNFAVLAGAVQAMNIGVGVISKETSGKTADFLLSKPVTRFSVLVSKLAAAVATLIVTNVIFIIASLIAAKSVSTESFSNKTFIMLTLTLFLVQLVFLTLGILFGVVLKKVKSVIAVSLPTVFAFFIIGTLGAILGNDNVRDITPFKYFDAAYIINNSAYETKFLVIEALVIIVALVASFTIFIRKDLQSST